MRSAAVCPLLHNALKASTSLQHAMLTGIQRVAKENIFFSDLNNLVVCTVAISAMRSTSGFTGRRDEDDAGILWVGDERRSQSDV